MKKRILVVDDEPVVTRLVTAILNSTQQYQVDSTTNACEAFEWAFVRGYDLLISDVRMPLMDGDQLYASVADLHEGETKRPKLLLMSGALRATELAERAGGIYFIQKPFVPELLLAQVASILADSGKRIPDLQVSEVQFGEAEVLEQKAG